MAVPVGGSSSAYLSEIDLFEARFRESHFISKDNDLYESLKNKYPREFDEFRSCFAKLQHFPDFPFVDEGIESCIIDLTKRTIKRDVHTESDGFVGQGSLNNLPVNNLFLKTFLLEVCHPLRFFSNTLHVVVKFHRRQIPAGITTELKGLRPHKDYDSSIIVMAKIEQVNLDGGRNQISNASQHVLTRDSMQEPGSYVVVNNEILFHELTQMTLSNPSKLGYRDVMILELKKA